uniref:SGNH hydrolase-type esterase domain-containing protein n=1 Tax=Anolis carolinensis TaxID=28377 RepID=A0A803T042_ANOCA
MQQKQNIPITCTSCGMFRFFTQKLDNYICSKCKQMTLMEQRIQQLEHRIKTLKDIQALELFLDTAQHAAVDLQPASHQHHQDHDQEPYGEINSKVDNPQAWKEVTHRRRRRTRQPPQNSSAQLHLHNRFEILTSLTYNQETHLVEDHSFLDTTQWTTLDQCAGDSPDGDSASPQSHLCNHANAPSPIIDQEQQEHPWESNGLSDVSQWIVIDECTGDVEEEDNTLHLHDSLQQEHSSGDIHTVLHKRDPVNPQRKQVLVVGDSLLRGTEAIISRPDGMARETCCLPGAKIHHITQRLSRLLKPHHPPHLMLIHVGTNDTARHTFQKITNDFRALGTKLKLYNVHVIFSSLLPVVGHGSTRAGKIVQVNNWLRKWCQEEHFGFLDHGLLFQEDGLLASDGVHLTQVGKHLFAHRLTNLIRRTLN